MKTFWKLVSEFWLPLIIALGWTGYSVRESALSLPKAIAAFSGAFFLASWATGQFVRVRRQAATENSLLKIEQRVENLLTNLSDVAQNIENTVTGGPSFCYMMGQNLIEGYAQGVFIHQGDYPLTGIHAKIVNDETFQREAARGNALSVGTNVAVGDLTPNTARPIENAIYKSDEDTSVHFGARNGLWTQVIKVRDGLTAWVVVRGRFHPAEIIGYSLPDNFPMIGDDLFDNRVRARAAEDAAALVATQST